MTKLTLLLVGVHFHPPAKTLLQVLPQGTKLLLQAEPDNPYDPAAVQVLLEAKAVSWEAHGQLEDLLPLQGMTLEQFLSTGPHMLGHVGASGGKPIAKAGLEGGMPALAGNKELLEAAANQAHPTVAAAGEEVNYGLTVAEIHLAFSPSGQPLIEVSWGD